MWRVSAKIFTNMNVIKNAQDVCKLKIQLFFSESQTWIQRIKTFSRLVILALKMAQFKVTVEPKAASLVTPA